MPKWNYVEKRFSTFLSNIELTATQKENGQTKISSVTKCLNQAYWDSDSSTDNSFAIGSWGKGTAIRPPRDVDLYFVLPSEVYWRFEGYSALSNKQSALLQEVKSKLLGTFSRSDIKGDGPVVVAAFASYDVEVVPAFLLDAEAQTYWVSDTKNGGSYILTMPQSEQTAISSNDALYRGNLRPLIKMIKTWQAYCDVPIKSFHLELLATNFISSWTFSNQGLFYYDWMCRDFFHWLTTKANSYQFRPGTFELVSVGDKWLSKATRAADTAEAACENERDNWNALAGNGWQQIFGADIPCIAE